ncbi:MAG: inositol monophosphatase family protein [Acidimicrobiales bacterium]
MTAPVDLDDAAALVGPLLLEAGELALRWFRTDVEAVDKGSPQGYDPVTEADRAVEVHLRSGLSARFPDHEIVGEEDGTSGRAGAVRWVIDPIDGTKAYVSGMPLWGILLGLVVDGRPVAGWVHQPYLRETFAAVGGHGWFERDDVRRELATRRTIDPADATMYSTHPSMFVTDDEQAAYRRLTGAVRLQRFGGDCYSYCLLALGHIDLVVESGLQPYDIIPLIPIVRAAGGVVTDRHGRPPLKGGFVIATATPELHARTLALVNQEAPHSE